ncbi:MAG: hypothetical protein ACK4HV_04750 [Parachlamydiaceae bacterium]
MVYSVQNSIDCKASDRGVDLKEAVIAAHKRIWHGQMPDQIVIDKRNSDNSCVVKAIVLNLNDLAKVTVFHVDANLYVSRM